MKQTKDDERRNRMLGEWFERYPATAQLGGGRCIERHAIEILANRVQELEATHGGRTVSHLVVKSVTLVDNPGNTALVRAEIPLPYAWNGVQSIEYLCHRAAAPPVGAVVAVDDPRMTE
jgi:hypothetical protein